MPAYPYALTLPNDGSTGDTSGFTQVQGTLAALASHIGGNVLPRNGTTFLWWSSLTVLGEAYQDVTLPSEVLTDVDSGSLALHYSAYLACGMWLNDLGRLKVEFLDGSDVVISTATNVKAHTVIYWMKRHIQIAVPSGTRKLRLYIEGDQSGGGSSQFFTFWDELEAELVQIPVTMGHRLLELTRDGEVLQFTHDANNWTLTGWQASGGTLSLNLDGGKNRLQISPGGSGYKVARYNPLSLDEAFIVTRLVASSGGNTGSCALVGDIPGEGSGADLVEQVAGYHGGAVNRVSQRIDDTENIIEQDNSVGGTNTEKRAHLWTDGVEAKALHYRSSTTDDGTLARGALPGAPDGQQVGLHYNSATATFYYWDFRVFKGRTIRVTGLEPFAFVLLLRDDGKPWIEAVADALGVAEFDVFGVDMRLGWTLKDVLVYDPDGTTLIAAINAKQDGIGTFWPGTHFALSGPHTATALAVVNPGAEDGDDAGGAVGWTAVAGSDGNISTSNDVPRTGSRHFQAATGDLNRQGYQDLAVPSGLLTFVDAGVVRGKLRWWQRGSGAGGGTAAGTVAYYDGSMMLLGSETTSDHDYFQSGVYWPRELALTVPANTRTVRLTHQVGALGTGTERTDDVELLLYQPVIAPDTPQITAVDQITAASARAHSSEYFSAQGLDHKSSRWRVYKASTDELVHDSGYDTTNLELYVMPGLASDTLFYVTVVHVDEEEKESLASFPFYFKTSFDFEGAPLFPFSDFAVLWQQDKAHPYYGAGLPGGWGVTQALNPLIYGRLGQWGRYLGRPSAFVNVVQQPTLKGHRVASKVIAMSNEAGWWPWAIYDAELAAPGIASLVRGTWDLEPDEAVWNIWNSGVGTGDMTGVWCGIEYPILSSAYGPCSDHGLAYHDATLFVKVFHQGDQVAAWTAPIPKEHVRAGLFRCGIAAYITLILDVQRDTVADPTGRTYHVKAAWEKTFRTDPLDGWDIEQTFVGGALESTPGAGDGGLGCGWGGAAGSRYTGAITTIMWGWSQWESLYISPYEPESCAVPPPTNPPPPTPPEGPPLPLSPAPSPCPPEEFGTHLELHLGARGSGGIYQYGADELDDGLPIIARVRPNAIAPAGFGGEALFRNIYLALTHRGDASLQVVPILDGEVIEQEGKELFLIGSGVNETKRFELALSRGYGVPEQSRYGMRGTKFSVELRINDICGSGLTLDGIEYEWEEVRERQPRVAYTQELLAASAYTVPWGLFLGERGGGALFAADDSSATDAGVPYTARAKGRWIAPAGVGGEAIFRNLYLCVSRWNSADLDIDVYPSVDGTEYGPIRVTLAAVQSPLVGEVIEVPLWVGYDPGSGEALRTHPRGAWFTARHEILDVPDRMLVVEGMEVESEIVRESLEAHPNG